jgi:enoyl-CoA hydratase/carnithine racemase
MDPARIAMNFFPLVDGLQHNVSSMERARVPVICAINGFCIGAGIDMATACDIRVCSKGSKFTIKEVDVGLAADIGTL